MQSQGENSTVSEIKENPGLFAIIVSMIIISLVYSFFATRSPVTNYRGVEENVIFTVQRTITDNKIYEDPEAIPYSVTQYMPLYYIIAGGLGKLGAIDPGADIIKVYQLTRGISLFFFGITLITIYQISFRLLKIKNAVIGMAPLLIGLTMGIPWYFAARPDSLHSAMLFLSIAAGLIYFQEELSEKNRSRSLMLSGVAAVLATFSKQNGLFILGLIFGYLLLFDRKGLRKYIFGAIIGTAISFLLFKPYINDFFVMNVIKGVDNGVDMYRFYSLVVKPFLEHYWFVSLSLVFCVAFLSEPKNRRKYLQQKPLKFLVFITIGLLATTLITAIKIGAAENYLIDISILILLATAKILDSTLSKLEARQKLLISKTFIYVIITVLILTPWTLTILRYASNTIQSYKEDDPYSLELFSYLDRELKFDPKAYIFTNERKIINRFPNNTVFPHQDIIANCTYSCGTFNYDQFQKDVESQTIKYIVYHKDSPKGSYAGVSYKNYAYLNTIDEYLILIKR